MASHRDAHQVDLSSLGEVGETFTRRDALVVGFDDHDLARLVHAGTISRLSNGVYRIGVTDLPDPKAVTRAMKVALSYQSAAAWLGGDLPFAPAKLNVTAPRNRGRRTDSVPDVRIHRTNLRADELLVVRGALVTSPVRTMLDVARSSPLPEAVAIGDSFLRRGGLARADAMRAAEALAPGVGRPAAVLASSLLDLRAESVFESMTRVELAVAGLPPPTPQLNIKDRDSTWIARVDLAWEDRRVVLECDGFEYHRDREAFQRDRRRWTSLTRAGWKVVVVTWHDVVADPAYVVEAVADLLGA